MIVTSPQLANEIPRLQWHVQCMPVCHFSYGAFHKFAKYSISFLQRRKYCNISSWLYRSLIMVISSWLYKSISYGAIMREG